VGLPSTLGAWFAALCKSQIVDFFIGQRGKSVGGVGNLALPRAGLAVAQLLLQRDKTRHRLRPAGDDDLLALSDLLN
jgi:hypothetical protein